MTKEHIIEKIEEYSIKHYSCDPTIKFEWWEMSNTDKAGFADELLSMLEQEKEEIFKNTLIKLIKFFNFNQNGTEASYSMGEIEDVIREFAEINGVEL